MSPKILTLIAYLAAAAGIALELLGVPGAGLALAAIAGWLGVRRPNDMTSAEIVEQIDVGVRAGIAWVAKNGMVPPRPGYFADELRAIVEQTGTGPVDGR